MAALRAVAASESPSKRPSRSAKTITQAAESGTARDLLVAMRSIVAKAVGDADTPARDLASLTKRLMEIARDIEAIDARDKTEATASGPVVDEAFDASAL